MAAPVQKILVAGDVEGNLSQLYKRISAVQKKAGNFDMLLCVGDFFGDDDSDWIKYKTGELKAPIATYILGANRSNHIKHFPELEGGEIGPEITYLGRRGRFLSSCGLSIAYLSGRDGASYKAPDKRCQFSVEDVYSLTESITAEPKFQGVDILLTSQWPQGVEKYASPVEGVNSKDCGSPVISQVALALKPRYHFCGLEGAHYERQPYRNHKVLQGFAKHTTRFISLANVSNSGKRKFLYAFNITPMKVLPEPELTKQPSDATECPYRADPAAFQQKSDKEETAQFFYDQKALDRGKKREQDQQGGRHNKKQPQPTGPCWFCLGSPEVERHLVVSVGLETYLALAKGGLTPDHVLICPVGHHQSLHTAPDDVLAEIDKYKAALRKYFEDKDKVPVFFERNYKTQHLQVQAVGVAADLAGNIQEMFQSLAQSQSIELHEIPRLSDLKQIVPEGAPYFFAEMPSGVKLLYRIKKAFPLQFGREVLAHESLLNMPERADWRQCKTDMDAETEIATRFRKNFKSYDNILPS